MSESVVAEAIRIAVIDDHAVIHEGIATWCAQAQPPIQVVGHYLSVDEFDSATDEVDAVVLDLQFGARSPDLSGVGRLAARGFRVIIFSQHMASSIVMQCLDLGAVTYLSKAEGSEHLTGAIRAAVTDEPFLSPTMAKAMSGDDELPRPSLSDREREVLISWFQTDSKELVGKRLFITAGTVATHLKRIRVKYAAVGRPASTKGALVARAIQDGLVTVDDL